MRAPETPLRALIVDDEPMARASLRKLLAADDEVQLVGECRNGDEALAALRNEKPDLVFLDVEMPGMGGIEVMRALREEERPAVVFTTAYHQYAAEAFDVHAVDYLLKPFDDERFHTALQRAKTRLKRDRVVDAGRRLADLIESVGSSPDSDSKDDGASPATRLTIKREGGMELVETSSIDWVEAADQYVRLHVQGGEVLMRESMSALERTLDPARFLRVHRSAIVALDRVRRLVTQGGGVGRLELKDGTWVPVSRSRLSTLRKRLG